MNAGSGRRVNARLQEDLFGKSFVHCYSAAERVRTGVSDSKQVKGSLQLSVLPLSAVQPKERDVCHAAQFDDVGTEKTVRLIRAGGFDRLDVRFGGIDVFDDPKAVVRKGKYLFQVFGIVGETEENIQQKSIVSLFKQGSADACTGGKGYVAFCAESSG